MSPISSQPPIEVDLLINARWVIPALPDNCVLENHAVAVTNEKIVAVLDQQTAAESVVAATTLQLDQHALIPGLINAHGHSPMTLFRGVADDTPLQDWLEQHIWPLEAKFVSAQFVQHGASLAIAEMIASGTTCFADMYFYPEMVAKAAFDASLRVQLSSPILDFPSVWAQDADEYILKATQLHDDYRHSELVNTAFGPHAPYTVSDAPLLKISTLAEELDIPIHMHVHETAKEVADAVAADGRRPLQRLAELGLISPRLVCIHATQLNDNDLELLSQNSASVVHCPESNMKLASGFCPVAKLLANNINVALGTDGCASNNDLDMFSEMRSAALLAKVVADDASVLPAYKALQMATINGARALGLEQITGSLEVGKYADMTAVNLDRMNSTPVYNPVSHLVYNTQASQVSHVWCSGKALLANNEFLTIDAQTISQQARYWQNKISA